MLDRIAIWCAFVVALLTTVAVGDKLPEITLREPGFGITADARVAPGAYELPDKDGSGAVVITGDNITVDFSGVTLVGSPEGTGADAYAGKGIVALGKNITITGAVIQGYKVGIYAEDSPGITVTECDVSRNYRQRLRSSVKREDVSDWLFGHENDDNQWLRYGSGIYLVGCRGATVSMCKARNGQNGICISRCDGSRIVDNDMSFMSGWGLAMWRSSRCGVFTNRLDWCVRGYSHDVYQRGQDSAGILVYEQCNDNVFAYNSATHCGDGLFLYAGNETVKKTGQGGCQRNLVFHNDFSHAVANGIEATFSQGNMFIKNILKECRHGVWAGYSYDTVIERNLIESCENGISVEHGRGNLIAGNTIANTLLGVHLWWDDDEDLLETPFCKSRGGCPSTANRIIDNTFKHVNTAIKLGDDSDSVIGRNAMGSYVRQSVRAEGNVGRLRVHMGGVGCEQAKKTSNVKKHLVEADAIEAWSPKDVAAIEAELRPRKGSQRTFVVPEARRGKQFIFIDEWGPYDFADVRVFPRHVTGGNTAAFNLLGPDGTFHVANVEGNVRVEPLSGRLPAALTVEAGGNGTCEFAVDIQTKGKQLRATGFLVRVRWQVKFYAWSEDIDPREGADNWERIISSEPLLEKTCDDIDFTWSSRSPGRKVPRDRFATVATSSVSLPAGRYRIQTVSDDGVRVLIDDEQVLANWTWHAPAADEVIVDLKEGVHSFRIEHFEIDGSARLQLTVEPA